MNEQKSKNKIKLNFIWQLGIEITNMMLPLITSPILSRRLGAESIGLYSYVYSISYYFVRVAVLGMFQYGTREIALVRDNRDRLNQKFSELFFAQVFIGVIVLGAFLFYSIFLSRYPSLFLIELISLVGSSLLLINWLFAGLEEFKLIAIKTMIIRIIGVILIVLLVQTSADLPMYFLIMAAEPLMGALVYIYLARGKVKLVPVDFKASFAHLRGMVLLFVPVLTTYLYSSMDKVMLGKLSTMTELGFYENATKALIAKNLATALSTVLVPRMSNLIGKNNNRKFDELMQKSLDAVLLLTVAFGFGTAAISSVFSVVFWGESFASCGSLILIMSLTIPAYGLTYVINNQFLVPLKKETIYIWATALGVIFNFIFNYIMIPQYAAIGASIATLITQYLVLVIECIAIRKELSIVSCLKRNWIYVLFGFIMIILIKRLDVFINYSILGLLIEVVAGILIFGCLSICYWLISGEKQYLNIFLGAFKKKNM